MRCPKCGSLEDRVLETRQSKDGIVIKEEENVLNVVIGLPLMRE